MGDPATYLFPDSVALTRSPRAGQGRCGPGPRCRFSSEPTSPASLPAAQITGKELAGVWWELEEETCPPAPTSLAPTLLLHKPGARIPAEPGRLRVAGVGHGSPAPSPPPADSVWPAQGVFVCICSSTSLPRSL